MSTHTNQDVAELLKEIAFYLDMQGVAFKPRAYEKAGEAIAGMEQNIQEIYRAGGLKALEAIPGVGVSIAEKIEELLKTGRVRYFDDLKKKTPIKIDELMGIEGIGPKSVKKLNALLGIRTLKDLERAARQGKIGELEGFGKKTEARILAGIASRKSWGGRFVLGKVMPQVRILEAELRNVHGVEEFTIAGSVRRRKETVGDVDILVVAKKSAPIMNAFTSIPGVARVLARGNTKSSVKMKNGLQVDLRVVPKESYGAALNYFTGSKAHNVTLRQIAIKKGYKLNEYGLWKGTRQIAGDTEEGLYKALGMDYIEPEMREETGEIERAMRHQLPALINYGDIKGDLQVQTSWTDGAASIEEMARAAIAQGLSYIAITDHTKRLAMTGGLDEKKIVKQMAEIDRLNKKFAGKIKILKGTECDILKDGSMDLPDSILSKLDVVGASVHSYFNVSKKDQTARILRAISNPHVDILFHPTGRVINRRKPYEVDIDEVIGAAKSTGTVLEIDAYPERLDLKDEYIRKCVEAGVMMSIDSDAHSPVHFPYLEYGIAQARRGWAEKKDIINAHSLEKMLKMLK